MTISLPGIRATFSIETRPSRLVDTRARIGWPSRQTLVDDRLARCCSADGGRFSISISNSTFLFLAGFGFDKRTHDLLMISLFFLKITPLCWTGELSSLFIQTGREFSASIWLVSVSWSTTYSGSFSTYLASS